LINVLLNDGSLYVKGCYNRWACPHYDPEDPIKYFETWTLIAEDVADYDTAVMGTIIKFNDGTAAYYGFDTIHYGKAEFSYKVLMSDKTSYIAATDNYVMLLREGKWYFWGSRFSVHFDDTSKDYYVLSGKPYILEVE